MNAETSGTLFQFSFWIYLAAGANYVWLTARTAKDRLTQLAPLLMLLGFAAHTAGLFFRWYEAGKVEVAAAEKAIGFTLTGTAYWEVMIQHPPFSNLYESLVFFSWGMVLVFLFLERRYRVQAFGVVSAMLVVATMGLASLTPGQQVKPLVPALQSWWMHVHVINASIAYPSFLLAALAAALYLIKIRTPVAQMGMAFSGLMAFLMVAVGRGLNLFTGSFNMILTFPREGQHERLMYGVQAAVEGKPVTEQFVMKMAVPAVQPMFLLTLVAAVVAFAGFAIEQRSKADWAAKMGRFGTLGIAAGLSAALGAFAWNIATFTDVTLSQEAAEKLVTADVARRLGEGARVMRWQLATLEHVSLSLYSNPFIFMMLVICLMTSVGFIYVMFRGEKLAEHLPTADQLDRLSNRAVYVGYPAITLLLITGMIWAHYSWGRYWGWDPKETWALITWMLYTGYLHLRVVHGTKTKLSAALAVAGFVVVIFTYLGVNLGLTGDGLHSYGSV
jgi:cytochrome c-type biogenesis protein CcsB